MSPTCKGGHYFIMSPTMMYSVAFGSNNSLFCLNFLTKTGLQNQVCKDWSCVPSYRCIIAQHVHLTDNTDPIGDDKDSTVQVYTSLVNDVPLLASLEMYFIA